MAKKEDVIQVAEIVQDTISKIIDDESDLDVLGSEFIQLAGALKQLDNRPPTLKTSDFGYDIGEKKDLDEQDESIDLILERTIDESDLLPIWFLEHGAIIQRAVARVVLTKPHLGLQAGTGWATGFMVSPSLFLTNNHVIADEPFTKKIRIQFNYQLSNEGLDKQTESFYPAQNDIFHTKPELDYTIIRLRPNLESPSSNNTVLPGNRWGFIPLNDSPEYRENQHFNIIQHPAGRRKEIALQNNEIEALFGKVVRYKTDTERGSSGSPVLDNIWRLVALHHAGGERNEEGKWINNQGIRIDGIVEDLRQHFTNANKPEILEELGI